ncbi:spermidine/putrescine transport system permease protein [Dongia mobilis]|uniref:Spermidine/putrescine transport system permease protein n=1 Tax=Dongia mobilis TaxID=578943 RepID=A0A4R6WKC9_9PROT|nr:ABC transporter permease subunit [Dongia mobilis]TDQ81013.1 spermidine/putrescine transport system permease protein [Dongia mobilis]
MSSRMIMRGMIGFYILLFFGYLFGPLVVMSITAFNTPSYPAAYPFEAFTLDWFVKLWNHRNMMDGLKNSIIIGIGVVAISVPVGLAASIIMSQIYHRARSLYYLITISPLLTPGVIIGISTVIFWRDVLSVTDVTRSMFYNGMVLTVLGQASFISAYCLLIFMARLTRFDRAQEEAALDLGASYPQVFWHILLPFLKPAVVSAIVIAFLTSFENYNTTTFAILADKTLVTVLAGEVRQGTTPALSALAVIIIAISVVGAVLYEVVKRREQMQAERAQRQAILAERGEVAAVA